MLYIFKSMYLESGDFAEELHQKSSLSRDQEDKIAHIKDHHQYNNEVEMENGT